MATAWMPCLTPPLQLRPVFFPSLSNADTLHADASGLVKDRGRLTGADAENDQSDACKDQKNGNDILLDKRVLFHKASPELALLPVKSEASKDDLT